MLISRRNFLLAGASAALLALTPMRLWAAPRKKIIRPKKFIPPDKTLILYNTHTGEKLKETFYAHGKIQKEALKRIGYLLRDHRTNQIKAIDIKLIELMFSIKTLLDYKKPFEIISGYRSSTTNNKLKKAGRGVAKNSYHVKGQAVDIAFTGLTLPRAYRAAQRLSKGGVGYYSSSKFIHMDVRGKPTCWHGA